MIVVPLPGVLAVYWSVPHVPFLPPNMGTGTMSGTFLCSPSWHGKHKARVRYICVGHEKSSIIPIWQKRKVRPTSERNVPKVTEPSSPSGSKTNSMECTLHSTNQPVWCQMVYKAVCLSVTDLIQLWSRVESQNGSTCVAPDFCLQCPNSGKALPGFQPLRAPWLARERGVTWFFSRGSMNAKPRQHMWSGSGPHVLFWLDIFKEASASPAGHRGALGLEPAQCPLTVLAGWLRPGAPRTGLGIGEREPGCRAGSP